MSQEQGRLTAFHEAFDEAFETADEGSGLPTLELDPAGLESKESRRETLSRLDHLLEELELANLAELPAAPPRVVRKLSEHGLSDARRYTIVELIGIVLNSQGPLMKANRTSLRAIYLEPDVDTPRRRLSHWGFSDPLGATGS